MKINKCKLCGNDEIILTKERQCEGFGEYCFNWNIKCNNCGCMFKFAADNFYNREYYTEEQVIERWNQLHEL